MSPSGTIRRSAKTILEQEKFPFDQEMVFYVPAGNTTRERAAVLIQQNLQDVGIKVTTSRLTSRP